MDADRALEVVGMAQGAAHCHQLATTDWAAAEAWLAQGDFPRHGVVLRPQGTEDPRVFKDLPDLGAARTAFEACKALADDGRVFFETDLRAHANPTRMQLIGQAARDLLSRLQSACPACARPGYAVTRREPGLPCRQCRRPTRQALNDVWTCTGCGYQKTQAHPGPSEADPRHCDACNP